MGLCFYTLSMLLLFSSTLARNSAEGRAFVQPANVAKGKGEGSAVVDSMIGSKPPRCDRRCISCGHCEAIQVPVAPQMKGGVRHFSETINTRGDDSSNYKPMNWKCKCGDLILNP